MKLAVIIILLLSSFKAFAAGGVYINEFLAQNTSGIVDEAGQHEDWIELYNSNAWEVDLSGWTLTDDPAEPKKWAFPAGTKIPAKGFIFVWADDDLKHGPLHTNFKLSKDGEFIGLYLPGGVAVGDSLSFGAQSDNVSFGRLPDGSSNIKALEGPTPGFSNSLVSIEEIIAAENYVYPNPAKDFVIIPQAGKAEIYNSSGALALKAENETKIDISALPAGIYFVRINSKIYTFIKK